MNHRHVHLAAENCRLQNRSVPGLHVQLEIRMGFLEKTEKQRQQLGGHAENSADRQLARGGFQIFVAEFLLEPFNL